MKIVAGKALNHRKPMHAPDEARGEQREVLLAGRHEGDPDVGEQDDRRAARGEAVEPVGQVDRARRARDDEVDEQQVRARPPERAEVDLVVDDAEAQRLGEVRLLGSDPPQGDRDERSSRRAWCGRAARATGG
jgi:hypothetical protein